MSLRNNQKGFSLIEGTVTLGLLGITSLYSLKVMEERALQEYNLKTMAAINNTVTMIQKVMNTPENCQGALVNPIIDLVHSSTTLGTPIIELGIPKQGSTGRKVFLRANKFYDYFYIPPTGINLLGTPTPTYFELVVDFKIKGKSWIAKHTGEVAADYTTTITRRIPIIGKVDAANKLLGCETDVGDNNEIAQERFCQSLGVRATWNTVTKKCILNNSFKCAYDESPIKITSTGSIVCGRLENRLDLNDLFDTSTQNCTGGKTKFQIVDSNGKFGIRCHN